MKWTDCGFDVWSAFIAPIQGKEVRCELKYCLLGREGETKVSNIWLPEGFPDASASGGTLMKGGGPLPL